MSRYTYIKKIMDNIVNYILSISKKTIPILILLLLVGIINNCSENPIENGDEPPIIGGQAYPYPYKEPSVSFYGSKIVFYRAKITRIDKDGYYNEYDSDSTGFWVCNIDGSEMKLIYKNSTDIISNPQFTPDMKLLIFVKNGQICKANYTGELINDEDIEQLTFEGRNFFPSISPDGNWISFDSDIASSDGGYRIWKMKSNGTNKEFVTNGREPFWSRNSNWIYYIGLYREIFKVNVNDTSEIIQLTNFNENDIYATYNSFPRANYKEELLAWTYLNFEEENIQIYLLDMGNNNTRKLTFYGATTNCAWTPFNKIVYVHYAPYNYDINNGTIWIMNSDGSDKKQITFNHDLKLE